VLSEKKETRTKIGGERNRSVGHIPSMKKTNPHAKEFFLHKKDFIFF